VCEETGKDKSLLTILVISLSDLLLFVLLCTKFVDHLATMSSAAIHFEAGFQQYLDDIALSLKNV